MRHSLDDILRDWPYDPENLNARVITFEDGRQILQIRIDMGLLQLEMTDRPDGLQPEGHKSWLDYYLDHLRRHQAEHHTTDGFGLDATDCERLRDEATLVYQRYAVLHHLGYHTEVARDTARNLRVADFLKRHARRREDSWAIERYRPYILMMNALARAELYITQLDYTSAERVLTTATTTIRAFAAEHVQVDCTSELEVLADRLRSLDRGRPQSDIELLQRQLDEAVSGEDFETAAALRDRIRAATESLPRFWE